MKRANVFGVIGLVLVGLMAAPLFSGVLHVPNAAVGGVLHVLWWSAFGCVAFACVKGSRLWWLVPLVLVSLVGWALWINVRG